MTTQKGRSPIRLVVGLGNPGPEYAATRHNAGYMVLDRMLARTGGPGFKHHRFGLVASYGPGIFLLKPLTFMNLSGDAVAPMMRFLRLQPGQILVISDDLDLELGRIRVRLSGSAGGHNGLKSIAERLGTEAFARVRVGIGRPRDVRYPVIDWVLGRFSGEEQKALNQGLERAEGAVSTALSEGVEAAMNRWNQTFKG
ncbi:MAG: aminoacyl-tRNA hydrolase [Firmicutes bacterium]|jgi:PTH1 family peptidyl-tRNA hydrolase|nr:aminoacyl-tRNA hydrolase [Bacillota bacterium]